MKDNDQSRNLGALIDAGTRSLKIEGRYKDMDYVKDITAHHRLLLNKIPERRAGFVRAASGDKQIFFALDVDKNFNRGHTDYFAQRRQDDIGTFDSPTYLGVEVGAVTKVGADHFDMMTNAPLANGDGPNYMNKRTRVDIGVNTVREVGKRRWRVFPNEAVSALRIRKRARCR